jgi:hypothetical protein
VDFEERNLFPKAILYPFVSILPGLFLFLSLPGCGGKKSVPVGEVFGKVTFQGKPVDEGRVTFMNKEAGTDDEALLSPDGTYTIKAVPVGEYKITIIPLIVRERADPKGPVVGVEKPAPNIPPKYRNSGTTDLTATVKEGKNELNFDLIR